MTESPWKIFARERTLGADAAPWCELLATAEDATADDVVAFLEAALETLGDLELWQQMFDPLLERPGLVERWRDTTEPLRSLLGHGLLRAGRIDPVELAARNPSGATELLETIARSYLDGAERALVFEELEFDAACWPAGALARAVRDEALEHDEPLPASVVRFAAESASPREAMLLALRAFTDETRDVEPDASWERLAEASEQEVEALVELAREWRADPDAATPLMRFRTFRLVLERGLDDQANDSLLSGDMFDWTGDLSSSHACGLCGGEHDQPSLPIEPSMAVVKLLAALPNQRVQALIARAEPEEPEVATLVGRWLTEGRDRFNEAAKPHARDLEALSEPMRAAIDLAGARLMVAAQGHLPRTQQREVIATFSSAKEPPSQPGALPLHTMARNLRARVKRLLELNAPIVVFMHNASRLRSVERLLASRESDVADEELDESDPLAVRREAALSLLVLRDLCGGSKAFEAADAQLERLAESGRDDAPNAAASFDASNDASTDATSAIGHYAFCALDIALGDHQRTDQDALYDIAERAMDALRRERSALANPLDHADAPDHAARDAEERRHWWLRWLLEWVPEAARIRAEA